MRRSFQGTVLNEKGIHIVIIADERDAVPIDDLIYSKKIESLVEKKKIYERWYPEGTHFLSKLSEYFHDSEMESSELKETTIFVTNSPLVCHFADTLWRYDREDNKLVRITDVDFYRIKWGSFCEALLTGWFGNVQRSIEGAKKHYRLAELNHKERHETLSDEERIEQEWLSRIFVLTAK